MLLTILGRGFTYVLFKESIKHRFTVKPRIQINMGDGFRFVFGVGQHALGFFSPVAVDEFVKVAIEMTVEN